MPTKKTETYGPTLKIDDVFRVAELARLAEDWARQPNLFETSQLNRYRELSDQYGVDSAWLLYATQNLNNPADSAAQTGVFPQVGELQQDQLI